MRGRGKCNKRDLTLRSPKKSRAVKRNRERFPDDFMLQLTYEEFDNLKYHCGTSRWGGRRYLPVGPLKSSASLYPSKENEPWIVPC